MTPRSLAAGMTRRWTLFAVALTLVFSAGALLLLFLLEDSLLDRRLQAVAQSILDPVANTGGLPPQFRAYSLEDAPLDVHARLAWAAPGEPFELRRADGSYAHVLVDHTPSGRGFVLIYDVTAELAVSTRWRTGLLLAVVATGGGFLAALALARGFVSRTGREASGLVAAMKQTRDPAQLRILAGAQSIQEFRELLELHADAWEAELASVERETSTLAHLAHELRTPLQSARTSLDILEDDRTDPGAWARLRRALNRLHRASSAMLWMSTDRQLPGHQSNADAAQIIAAMAQEFAPFAKARHQQIHVEQRGPLHWGIPEDVADALIGNLLMNAIQHGLPGRITVLIEADAVAVVNAAETGGRAGFGFGLQIVQRLADRVGWRLDVSRDTGVVVARLMQNVP